MTTTVDIRAMTALKRDGTAPKPASLVNVLKGTSLEIRTTNTGIDGGITSRRYAEEMLTEVFIIYLMNAIQQVVMTSCPKIIT